MVPPATPAYWSRAAALSWVAAISRGAAVTGAQHNAIVATLAAARDALADPSRPRATPDVAGAVVGSVALPASADAATVALWDATGRLLADLANPIRPTFALVSDEHDGPGVLVYVDGAAARALVDPRAPLFEAPAVRDDGPALVRAAIQGAMVARSGAAPVANDLPARRSRVADLAADALDAAGRWLAVPKNRARALEVVGALAVGGTAAAGAVARGQRRRGRRRST